MKSRPMNPRGRQETKPATRSSMVATSISPSVISPARSPSNGSNASTEEDNVAMHGLLEREQWTFAGSVKRANPDDRAEWFYWKDL